MRQEANQGTVQTQRYNMKTPPCSKPLQSSGPLVFSYMRGKVIPQGMQETLFIRAICHFWAQCPFVLVTSHTRIHEILIAVVSAR